MKDEEGTAACSLERLIYIFSFKDDPYVDITDILNIIIYLQIPQMCVCVSVEGVSREPFILSASHLACVLLMAQGSALCSILKQL